MGASTLLDIVGSILIGGVLLLILFRLQATADETSYDSSQDLIVQQNLTTLIDIIQSDFRKIGYCADYTKITNPADVILYADSNKIEFIADLNDAGVLDTVDYYTGPTSELANTPNPNDRLLYRVINGETPKSSNLGVTEFKLIYLNSFGDTLNTPVYPTGQIAGIQVDLEVENPESMNGEYQYAYWRQVNFTTRNLNNR
jgi:hypothetical protein